MEWKINYNKLKQYYLKQGNSRVPYRYKKDPALGGWVSRLRRNKSKLSKQKVQLLQQLNFAWSGDIEKEKRKHWLLMFSKLKKFKESKGHCNVPSKYTPDRKLGRWVEVLRTNQWKLDDWQIKKLKNINFKWSEDIQTDKEKKWYSMYRSLEAFFIKYGHSDVPEYWKEDESLSIWVMSQRRPKIPHSKDKLSLLKQVNFSFNNSIGLNKRDSNGRFISKSIKK
jgi:hypothetical protein